MPTSPTPQPPYSFGAPWPELNEGLSYADAVPSIHPGWFAFSSPDPIISPFPISNPFLHSNSSNADRILFHGVQELGTAGRVSSSSDSCSPWYLGYLVEVCLCFCFFDAVGFEESGMARFVSFDFFFGFLFAILMMFVVVVDYHWRPSCYGSWDCS